MTHKTMIDVLADQISKVGNCEVKVVRLIDPDKDRLGRPKVGAYQIHVKRGEHSMTFGDFKVAEAKRTLAMIADLLQQRLILPPYPTYDAYMKACRATHWRNEQLRAHGIEPLQLTEDMPHYPPEDFDFGVQPAEARGIVEAAATIAELAVAADFGGNDIAALRQGIIVHESIQAFVDGVAALSAPADNVGLVGLLSRVLENAITDTDLEADIRAALRANGAEQPSSNNPQGA